MQMIQRPTLKACDISNLTWDSITSDSTQWQHLCQTSDEQFKAQCIDKQISRQTHRKTQLAR